MAKVKGAKKKKPSKKSNRRQQVRLLEAEILANRMRDFMGAGERVYDAYGLYGGYGLYGVYGGYGFGAYAQEGGRPITVQIRPNGQVIIKAPPRRQSTMTIQIWPDGKIGVQESRPAKRRKRKTEAAKKVAKKKTKKARKKTVKKRTKKASKKPAKKK